MPAPTREPTLENAAEPARSGAKKHSLGSQITGWTNNLLATSVVIVVAIAVGSQLITLWSPSEREESKHASQSWPTLESCAIEFGNRPYLLKREQLKGDQEKVVQSLTRRCKEMLNHSPTPHGEPSQAELQMIQDAQLLTPISEDAGKWRLFQVKDPRGNEVPMLIGLRDDCQTKEHPFPTRMVTWGIGMQAEANTWTTFVCTSATSSTPQDHWASESLVPLGSQRSMAIGSQDGGQLIGFYGGETREIVEFYSRWVEQNDWQPVTWRQNADSWEATLRPRTHENDRIVSIQIQLTIGEPLRGLINVQPKTKHNERNSTE